MELLVLFFCGLFASLIGTLLGIGGGIFVSPILFLVYHLSPQKVIGTSLAMVLCNSTSGTIAYAFQHRINYKLGWQFALFTIPGAVIGAYISRFFNPLSFRIVFSVLLIVFSIYLFIHTIKSSSSDMLKQDSETSHINPFRFPQYLTICFLSLGVGILSSLLGIGGGIIHIPILIYILKIPVHMATATSHFILAFSSLSGVISHLWLGNIEIYYAIVLGSGAIIGAQVGAFISKKVRSRIIILLLAAILILTGIRLLTANLT